MVLDLGTGIARDIMNMIKVSKPYEKEIKEIQTGKTLIKETIHTKGVDMGVYTTEEIQSGGRKG